MSRLSIYDTIKIIQFYFIMINLESEVAKNDTCKFNIIFV